MAGATWALMRSFKLRDPAISLPEFHIIPINELDGPLLGGLIIRTDKIDTALYVPVRADEVGAVCHLASMVPNA
jgi:hypothetical protein